MLALSLGLAQAGIVAGASMRPLMLLLDDPASEVDREGAARLVAEVTRIPAQRFITGLRPDSYPCEPNRVFHVKQGEFSQVL
jgi:recombinational DNA repair ATPase RecF